MVRAGQKINDHIAGGTPDAFLLEDAWKFLGKRWTLLILTSLGTKQVLRFNELKKLLPGISNRVLSDRLGELVHEGLIQKQIHLEIPTKVEYRLTKKARELDNTFAELIKWVSKPENKKSLIQTVRNK